MGWIAVKRREFIRNSVIGAGWLWFSRATPFAATAQRWPAQQANDWYTHQPFLVGSNFIPSTAINELEMWQADTFDLPTIDRELGWAEGLGMNTMRVFLHNLLWQQDSAGFLRRTDQPLAAKDQRGETTSAYSRGSPMDRSSFVHDLDQPPSPNVVKRDAGRLWRTFSFDSTGGRRWFSLGKLFAS